MKKLLALALALMMALSLTTALAEGGTFSVGMECDYAPFNWTQAEPSEFAVPIEGGMGYADGYDVQIAKMIAEGLGLELVIVKTEWNGLPMGVTSGMFDAIIAGMSPTEERKVTLDFSANYYVSDLVVVVRKDSPYAGAKTLADLSGATITGQQGTFHYSVIDQIPGVKKDTAQKSFPVMITALQSGAIDGYVSERPGAISAAMSYPDLMYVVFDEDQGFTYSLDEVSIAVGLNKGSPLLSQIDEILAGIDEATRQQIMEDAIARQPLSAEE